MNDRPTNKRGHRLPTITEEAICAAVAECHDMTTGDVARHMMRERSTVLKALRRAETAGSVKCRYVQDGTLALWSICNSP